MNFLHMSSVYAIRSHTLIHFEHVQKLLRLCVYPNLHRRMSAYLERTRRMHNIPLTYICVCVRIGAYEHTPYARIR